MARNFGFPAREETAKPNWSWIAMVAFWLVVALFFFGAVTYAFSHIKGWSKEDNEWLGQQKSGLGDCCSGSEAKALEDPEWHVTDPSGQPFFENLKGEKVKCEVAHSQVVNSAFPAAFCVKLGHTWWAVPTSAVSKSTSIKAYALVWPVYADEKTHIDEFGDPVVNYIRCFKEGARA